VDPLALPPMYPPRMHPVSCVPGGSSLYSGVARSSRSGCEFMKRVLRIKVVADVSELLRPETGTQDGVEGVSECCSRMYRPGSCNRVGRIRQWRLVAGVEREGGEQKLVVPSIAKRHKTRSSPPSPHAPISDSRIQRLSSQQYHATTVLHSNTSKPYSTMLCVLVILRANSFGAWPPSANRRPRRH
jgi:hypothetical protein